MDNRIALQSIGVSVFPKEKYGFSKLNFTLEKGKKYKFTIKNQEVCESILGFLEGRYPPQSGVLHRSGIVQSDRLLLGKRVYTKSVGKYLAIKRSPAFFFNSKRRYKSSFLQDLRASSLASFPIYRLRGTDRLKFVLLALCFQETGCIVISSLPYLTLEPLYISFLEDIFLHTQTTVIFCDLPDTKIELPFLGEFQDWTEIFVID